MRFFSSSTLGVAGLFLLFLLPSCDSGNGGSYPIQSFNVSLDAPSSKTTAESFEIKGTAQARRQNGEFARADSIKVYYKGELLEANTSSGTSSVTAIIESSMTSIGGSTATVRAWKTENGEQFFDEMSQNIKIIEAPPQSGK